MPCKYPLKSTNEIIDILKSNKCDGILASLDVESLFTNVPIEETIKIISTCIYNNNEMPPLNIPQNILEDLLRACTTKAIFRSPEGKLYNQINGIAMVPHLDELLRNFKWETLITKSKGNSKIHHKFTAGMSTIDSYLIQTKMKSFPQKLKWKKIQY